MDRDMWGGHAMRGKDLEGPHEEEQRNLEPLLAPAM